MEDFIQLLFTIALFYIAFGPILHLIIGYFLED